MKTKNLTVVAIVAVVATVGLLNIANAVPGAGKSGNPPSVQPATELQNLVDCCQHQATIAEYQDNAPTNQVMGTCTRDGIETFRTGGVSALQSYISNTCGGVCVEVSEEEVRGGACTDVSFIEEANLPQCCGFEGPQGGRTCGADQEWVVGVAAFPTCYIPGS